MRLDLTAFTNAIARLREAIDVYARDPSQSLIRDGVIQRFGFTYELAHKKLRRALKTESASPDQYEQMSFADLIRSGSAQGLLLGDWPQWRTYRDMRSKTNHAYDEAITLEVVGGIAGFLRDAEHLRDRL